MESKGTVFSIQRFSTDDGGGIRTCVFLKGCPLRCLWCHNAEGISPSPELAVHENACIGCGTCAAVCPTGAVTVENGRVRLDRKKCAVCGTCAAACPTDALKQMGKQMTVEEVLETVRRDRPFYGKTGGMTITGGEPMAQAAFAVALAKAARAEGISVAMETSGFGKTEDFKALLPFCDLFLFDCKASSERHSALTGATDELILKNLDVLCQSGASVVLRCPLVIGANADDSFTEKIVFLSQKYPSIHRVQLMPYHKTGASKAVALGKECQPIFDTPDESTLSALAQRITRESGKEAFF